MEHDTSTSSIVLVLAAIALFGLLATSLRALEPIHQTWRGVAIDGYDPVAYFTEQKPVKGSADYAHTWKGAEWRFSSAENRDLFAAEPEKYAPQYGGYCAYAVSQGKTAGIDPKAWSVVDGKLYLNYNAKIQKRWEGDRDAHIQAADGHWPTLLEDG